MKNQFIYERQALVDVLDIIKKVFDGFPKPWWTFLLFKDPTCPEAFFLTATLSYLFLIDLPPIHNFHIFGPVPKNSKVPKRFQKTQKSIFTRSERFYLKLSVGRSVLR